MAHHILDAKPTVSPASTAEDFRSAWTRSAAAERASLRGVDGPADAGVGPSTPAGGSPSASAGGGKRSKGADRGGPKAPGESGEPSHPVESGSGGDEGLAETDADENMNRREYEPPPPSFADAEAAVLAMDQRPAIDQVDPVARKRSRARLASSLRKIRKLEASAQAATARAATAKNSLGVLQGHRATFQITRRETVLGRSTEDQKVDVDLAEEGNASKVSRQHAFIKLRWNGEFVLRNVGKRHVWINNVAVESGRRASLAPHSLIEVGGLRLMFLPNPTLVRASEPEPF